MKKALMILMALTIVTVGAFAGDYHVGANLKGVETVGDVSVAVEVGYTSDYVGVYGQVGVTDFSGLLGVALTLPKSPVSIYGGAGVQIGSKTITTTDTYSVVDDHHDFLWFGHNSETFVVTTTNEVDEAAAFFEAGVGFDVGPMLWKVGWSNKNGNALSFTLAASI